MAGAPNPQFAAPGLSKPDEDAFRSASLGHITGVLPSQKIHALHHRGMISSAKDLDPDQIQPASLDLRLGAKAYRVRASFLPGRARTVRDQLEKLQLHEFSLEDGAVLERGGVYIVELQESLALPPSVAALANPKSSTGRLDVFTRLICDRSDVFDDISAGYAGSLYAEISPRTFSIKVRKGSRLNQLRFRKRGSSQDSYVNFRATDRELQALHEATPLVDGPAKIRDGLHVRVNLEGEIDQEVVGYRAQKHTDIVDVDAVGAHRVRDFWEPIIASPEARLILDPDGFYILASKEALHIPPQYAAEMVPIDPSMGEFRVHYAGFFDPGFGHGAAGGAGSRAVLEVRSYEVPFILEDGQLVGRLVYERLAAEPDQLYGQGIGSNYQAQGLKLSKHFR